MPDQDLPYFNPETEQQLQDAIQWAISERRGLYLHGGNSKAGLGRPTEDEASAKLSLTRFNDILQYEPAELVMTTGAATPMAVIKAALKENNQILAFEPMDASHLLKNDRHVNAPTIGGVFSCNLSGPRRISQGAARDHFLGFKAISGRGEAFKSGGQVMKNVTGYDLSKLMAGSWGTLGAMHEVSFKVLPKAKTSRTVLITHVDHHQATAVMSKALQSPNDVSAACWLPEKLLKLSGLEVLKLSDSSAAACRIEGPEPSVITRCKALRDMFADQGKIEELHEENSEAFWQEIRDVMPYAQPEDDRVVWKISVTPSDGPKLIDDLNELQDADAFMDWGGGLVWVAFDSPKLGGERIIRKIVNRLGGHATLMRGSNDLRRSKPVFHPQIAPFVALNKRIKDQFDPFGILNPGRMYEQHGLNKG